MDEGRLSAMMKSVVYTLLVEKLIGENSIRHVTSALLIDRD